MTKAQLERVSRSFIGHLITDPQLRKAVRDASRVPGRTTPEARIAALINKTLAPKTPVKPEHVPAIRKRMNALVSKKQSPRSFEVTNEFNWDGDDE